MWTGSIRKFLISSRLSRRLSPRLPKISSFPEFKPFLYDAIPVAFSYDRLRRTARATVGVELERLLGTQDYFAEELYVLVEVGIVLPTRTRDTLQFSDAVHFSAAQSSGQESELRSRPSKSRASPHSKPWFVPGRPLVKFEGLDLAASLKSAKSLKIGYRMRRGHPEVISGGLRSIKRTQESARRFRWHGASVFEFLESSA